MGYVDNQQAQGDEQDLLYNIGSVTTNQDTPEHMVQSEGH
jgi:hypothetical protein